jgi:hypothetical protein
MLVLLAVTGCGWTNTNLAPGPPPRSTASPVRPADLEAWQGAPRIELETHPLFSTLPRAATLLSDGRELWDYPNCVDGVCCHNQFFLAGPSVQAYRAVGSCYTDCSTRPASRQCPPAELGAQAQAARTAESQERFRRALQAIGESGRSRPQPVTTDCREHLGGVRCVTE